MATPSTGDVHTFERTFTREDVQQFASVSGDTQPQHTEPDEEGRLLVHGLLTATLPTKIGGDLRVLARSMDLTFRRPVYTGEPITCTWTNRAVEELSDRYDLVVDVECTDPDDEVVLRATIEGLIWKEEAT